MSNQLNECNELQLHPELPKDLKKITDLVALKSLNNVHNALMGVLQNSRSELKLADFDHPDHLSHEDFVDESHHEFMLSMLNRLIEDLEPKDHLLVYEFIKSLHDRSKNIHDEHFAEHGFDHPQKVAARNFHDIIDKAHDLVKEKILFNLNLPADTELSESDFYQLLIENERNDILAVLNDKDSKYQLGDNLEDHHVQIIKDHHENKINIASLIDDHVKQYQPENDLNSKNDIIAYCSAFKEDKERFINKLPKAIQNSALLVGKVCQDIDQWAIFGSTAVSVQSENFSDKVDDIDIVFNANDLPIIQTNLDKLTNEKKIYQDENGEILGYKVDEINLFGNNTRLSGFIDSGEINTETGQKILVPFEAFAEDKDHGVTQIGHLPTKILKLEHNGINLQMLERESLIDHYTVIALSELYNDNFEKDKDLLRLQKIEQFGVNMFDGFKEAIKRIYARYPQTQNAKMQEILAKSEKCLNMIETAKQEFQTYTENAHHNNNHTELADIKTRLAEFNKFGNFKEFFEALKSRKQFFKEQVKSIESASSIDEVLSVHKLVHQEIDYFNDVFNAIKTNPEGKALYYLAMKRFIIKFLKDLYQKMDLQLDKFPEKNLSESQIKGIVNILKRSASYTKFKLYNHHYPEE